MSDLILGRHHVVLPNAAAPFYIAYLASPGVVLYKVTALAPAGGSASSIFSHTQVDDWNAILVFVSPQDTHLSFSNSYYHAPTQYKELLYSSDDLATWTVELTNADNTKFNDLKLDRSNRSLLWSVDYQSGSQESVVSADQGATWTRYTLDATAYDALVAPLHDNSQCYILTRSGSSVQIYRVDTAGAYTSQTFTIGNLHRDFFEADRTAPNTAYAILNYGELWKLDWSGATLTRLTEPWDAVNDTVFSLVVTDTGVLVVSAINAAWNTLKVYTSSNGGSTFTAHDLSADWTDNPILGYSSTGQLAFQANDGRVIYSGDDGATWNATAVIGLAQDAYRITGS